MTVQGAVLELQGVTRRFGGLVAVDGVTLSIGRGITAVIGPNGAGKTTLFDLMCGLRPLSAGRIRLPAHKRARLGMARTLQIKSVFGGLSVRENLWIAARQKRAPLSVFQRASRDAETSGTVDRILADTGLETKADLAASSLAYGDVALLEIAMALATSPRLLLLDEPVCGMSPAETQAVSERIRSIGARTDVVLIEHDMEMVLTLAQRVIVLAQGRLLADGTPHEIARNPAVMEAYLGSDQDDDV